MQHPNTGQNVQHKITFHKHVVQAHWYVRHLQIQGSEFEPYLGQISTTEFAQVTVLETAKWMMIGVALYHLSVQFVGFIV